MASPADKVKQALNRRYPGMTRREGEKATEILLLKLADELNRGADIGSVSDGPDGGTDINIFFISENAK